ncbi:MAG: VWA domain-containing protein [Blastocatellia bacterium]
MQDANEQPAQGASKQPAQDTNRQPAQDQPVRIKTDLIELRAVVTDKQGRAITDLKREDFELLENNKPQQAAFFSVVRIPGRGEAKPAETPAASGSPSGVVRPAETPARTVVLYVDTLHLSIQSLMSVKQALRKFIDERLTDQDLTAIVTSAGSLGVVEQFTRDRRVLRYAVDRLSSRPNGRASLFTPYLAAQADRGDREGLQVAMAVYAAEERIPPNDPSLRQMTEARARQIISEATWLRRAALLTLGEVVRRVADLPGQRLVVMASDGFTLLDQGGSPDTNDLQTVTSRAVRSGVIIYTIDAKGLQPPVMFDASLGAMPNDPRIASYSSAGERDLENGLNALAKDTGGEAFFNTNDTAGAMGRALDDNQVYYALAYYPAGEESEKKFRKITVKVRNHPEYRVRTQRGYLPAELAKKTKEAEALTPQQRFVNAMLAPLPQTTIGVTATADYIEFPQDAAQVTLQIHVDGRTLSFTEANGRHQFETEVVTMIFNSDGKRVDVKSETITGNLSLERKELAVQNGIQYGRRVALKPGLYQVRAGVREPAGERMGTAAVWVETADLTKKRLAMSSLILSNEVKEQPVGGNEAAPLTSRLAQGIRYYRDGQPLVYFFRLYHATEPDAVMQIEILKDEKPFVSTPWQAVATRLVGQDAKGMLIGGQLALGKTQPGIYELRVSVKSDKMKRPIQRSIPFGIEP